MRAKEFLRALSDMIDSIQDDESTSKAPPVIVNVNGSGQSANQGDPASDTETALDRDVFVPPLQTKIELMKKSVGQKDKNAAMFGSEDDGPFE